MASLSTGSNTSPTSSTADVDAMTHVIVKLWPANPSSKSAGSRKRSPNGGRTKPRLRALALLPGRAVR
jgi:hypothetical protein